jgi:hypothetical protein
MVRFSLKILNPSGLTVLLWGLIEPRQQRNSAIYLHNAGGIRDKVSNEALTR